MKTNFAVVVAFPFLLCLASVSQAAEPTPSQKPGAFLGCYSISTGRAGGPTLHLSLVFPTTGHDFTGHAQVTQALLNPVVLQAQAYGTFLSLYLLGSPYLVITGDGFPDLHWPPGGGFGPVVLPTLEFSLNTGASFSIGGQKGELPGKGMFRYRTSTAAEWTPYFEGTVETVPCATQ